VSLNSFVDVSDGLTVAGPTIVSTLAASGEVTIEETLVVTGDVSLNSFVDVSDGLTVAGPTTISTLSASGAVSLGDNVDISGELNVVGDVSLNASLSVTGDVSLNSWAYISDGLTVGGPTSVSTLTASNRVELLASLEVDGDVSLNSVVDISALNVSGTTTLNSDLVIESGDISLNNNLIVGGTSNFMGTVNIDGSLNVNTSSFTYTKTTVNSVNLDVSDNIIRINVKDTSANQTTNLPSGIMVQDVSKNVFFGYSGRKDGQVQPDKFVITKTDYDEGAQSDISLSFDQSVDVFVNGSLEVSGNVAISGSLHADSMVGFAYQVLGETNDLMAGEYPFAYGAGAYDQDASFGYPILINSQLVKVGLMLSDSSMASLDASINEAVFTIGNTDVTFTWEDLSGYCEKTTKTFPTKTIAINYEEGSMVNVKCKTLTLNNFPTRYDVVAVEKARLVMKFLTT